MLTILLWWLILSLGFVLGAYWGGVRPARAAQEIARLAMRRAHEAQDREDIMREQRNEIAKTLRNLALTSPLTAQAASTELSRVHEAWATDQLIWQERINLLQRELFTPQYLAKEVTS